MQKNNEHNMRYCKKCKKKTHHTKHGFVGSNYREACSLCETINYYHVW